MKRPDVNAPGLWTRRVLLQRALHLGAMGVATPLAINLAAIGEAAAFDNTDYKALVCIFLYGGNDYANTVVPYDATNYALYHQIRAGAVGENQAGIALARAALEPTALTPNNGQVLTDNLQYALAPQLTGLKSIWDAGRLAVQLNVGPLVQPTTLAQYQSTNRVANPLPPKLFSHNDQQSVWQSNGTEGSTVGWGGKLGDIAMSSNATNSLLTCISASGNAVFVAGRDALQYQVSPGGAVRINALNTPLRDALNAIITRQSSHVLENEYAIVTRRSMDMEGVVNTALSGVNPTTPFGTGNGLANQLKIVARLIGARATLGMRRQVFFVSLGGFDNHNLLMQDHPNLMTRVNEAMSAFYAATVELGVAEKVTTFTASDFGRTLSSNADGSDHGWGSHHFVMGGAVNGGRFYGTAPHVSIQTDDQVGQGRLLPSTSVDEFAATLARWFGCNAGELPGILPNVGNFTNTDLGFV
ncbi:MAG TPA: DUF1501 domain-containing protein [Steroidobacteraceae bacterium]|nr:DUF1501 domain-containing protein [Steroidobacteraceae bacterium]